jgi:hypothetical protein
VKLEHKEEMDRVLDVLRSEETRAQYHRDRKRFEQIFKDAPKLPAYEEKPR